MTEVPKEIGIFVDMKRFFIYLALALLLLVFGYFPAQVEEWYSWRLYPVLLTLRLWFFPSCCGALLQQWDVSSTAKPKALAYGLGTI